LNSVGNVTQKFQCDEPVNIELELQVRSVIPALYGYMEISKLNGTKVMVSDSYDVTPNRLDSLPIGVHIIQIVIPARTLAAGEYSIYLNFASIAGQKFNIDSPGIICKFDIEDLTTQRGNNRAGFFSTLMKWEIIPFSSDEKKS
jgi:lipopolysaccharide transport system ATP-binding protein